MKMGQNVSNQQGRGRTSTAPFSANNLQPIYFHQVHGDNVRLARNGQVARRHESFCKGIAFSNRPIKVNERVCVKFLETSTSWSGVLRFGFTSQDPATLRGGLPKYACPDLTNKPGYWAKALAERYAERGSVLHFFATSNGDVHYGVNGEEKGVFFGSVDTRASLWALVDVYGNTISVEYLDARVYFNNMRRTTEIEEAEEGVPDISSLSINDPPLRYNAGLRFFPIQFHQTKGRNAILSNDSSRAHRDDAEFCLGYVFSSRPMVVNDRLVIQVIKTDPGYVGALAFGVTSCDPSTLASGELPQDSDLLIDRPEYWVVVKDIASNPQAGDELSFCITAQGEVHFQKNGNPQTTVMHVDQTQRLWAVFDLYGSTAEIKLLGTTRDAVPTPRPSIDSSSRRSSSHTDAASPTLPIGGLRVQLPPDSGGGGEHQPTAVSPPPPQTPPSSAIGTSGDGSQDNASNECTVCYERPTDCVLYTCGHCCLCYECATQLGKRQNLCPICRCEIKDVIRIYRS